MKHLKDLKPKPYRPHWFDECPRCGARSLLIKVYRPDPKLRECSQCGAVFSGYKIILDLSAKLVRLP